MTDTRIPRPGAARGARTLDGKPPERQGQRGRRFGSPGTGGLPKAAVRRWEGMAWWGTLSLFVALTATPAHANPIGPEGVWGIIAIAVLIVAIPLFILYNLAVWLVEALLLNRVLALGYRRAFGYACLVNLASTGIGFLGYLGQPTGEGWKTALVNQHDGQVALLFVRSLAVAVVSEGGLLMLLLRKRRDMPAILRAAVGANLVSYGLTLLVLMAVRGVGIGGL